MAKYGEGDKRWIVEDRPDGTNVHNWHWAERDCLGWSRSFLSDHLSNLKLLDNHAGLTIITKSIDKLDGEAYVNIRKGKIIPGYELSFSLSFDAEARKDPSDPPFAKLSGTIEVPYLADENADEDPEVKITVRDDDGPIGRTVKDAFYAKGKDLVLEKIRVFVKAMAKGGPVKDEIESKKVPAAATAGKKLPSVTASDAVVEKKEVEKKKRDKEGFKTITMTERFYCRGRDIYEILMDENRWKGFTQSNARISKEVGGEFSLFDGSITGVNEELQEGKLIVQKWRFGSWPDGVYSTVRLVFDEPEQGVTVIKLTQTNVPMEDKYGNSTVVENTERGWKELIFNKIRAIFGFGI